VIRLPYGTRIEYRGIPYVFHERFMRMPCQYEFSFLIAYGFIVSFRTRFFTPDDHIIKYIGIGVRAVRDLEIDPVRRKIPVEREPPQKPDLFAREETLSPFP
jgi:hypothetical protein